MATLDENYIGTEIQADLIRWLPNAQDLIRAWRAQIAAGQGDFGPGCTQAAKGMLGRLLRLFNWQQANPTAFSNAIAPMAVTLTHLQNRVTAYRDAMRIFRDAPKTNAAEITAAVNALEAALPAPQRFLDQALPADW